MPKNNQPPVFRARIGQRFVELWGKVGGFDLHFWGFCSIHCKIQPIGLGCSAESFTIWRSMNAFAT